MRRLKKCLLFATVCAFSVAAFLPAAATAAGDEWPDITPGPDSPVKIEGEYDYRRAVGAIGTKEGIPVAEYLDMLDAQVPEGYMVTVGEVDGADELPGDAIVRTYWTYVNLSTAEDIADSAGIIIGGDVLGTGKIDIAQLNRMAKALNGSEPFNEYDYEEGDYSLAADVNGDGKFDISDLVAEARIIAS